MDELIWIVILLIVLALWGYLIRPKCVHCWLYDDSRVSPYWMCKKCKDKRDIIKNWNKTHL